MAVAVADFVRSKRAAHSKAPSFKNFSASSDAASHTKRSNTARNTRHELILRKALTARGARYRLHARGVLGKPDIVFVGAAIAVFCDGDFWHGRNWTIRKRKLATGANSAYWVAKIQSNVLRDRRTTAALRKQGWEVVRVWETEIQANADAVAAHLMKRVRLRTRVERPIPKVANRGL
ncbi:MAG: very short patch repair endonuclease [Chthoniobacterales bacterium]|nr:very short patch repair endonuclease [Chthoniobacterales bacterium]